jgi:hypothetical protein
MRKIVELKIEETKTVVGGNKAAAAPIVPSNPSVSKPLEVTKAL